MLNACQAEAMRLLSFLFLLSTLQPLVWTADIDHLATYFARRLAQEPKLKQYVQQASDRPLQFAQTVKQDLIESFQLKEAELDEETLRRYVNSETISMHFIQTGQSLQDQKALQRIWSDEELLPQFRMMPGLILSYQDPESVTVAAQLLQRYPQALRVFAAARHSRFTTIAAHYVSAVYRAYLFDQQSDLRRHYLQHCDQWLLALRFQEAPRHLQRESIVLAVKLCSQLEQEKERRLELQRLAALVVASDIDAWQRDLVQACVQLELSDYLEKRVKE